MMEYGVLLLPFTTPSLHHSTTPPLQLLDILANTREDRRDASGVQNDVLPLLIAQNAVLQLLSHVIRDNVYSSLFTSTRISRTRKFRILFTVNFKLSNVTKSPFRGIFPSMESNNPPTVP